MVVLPLSSVRGARAGQADPVLYYGQMIGWPGRRVGGGGGAIVTLVMDHRLSSTAWPRTWGVHHELPNVLYFHPAYHDGHIFCTLLLTF